MYKQILVPLDGSATAERGLREAIALASGQKEIPRLVLLHVVGDFSMLVEMSAVASYQEMLDGLRRYGQDVLAKAKTAGAGAGIEADTTLREVTQGRIAEVIVDEARSASCDLIVMGTHGRRGFSRVAMGSDAEQVVRTSPIPVLLVRHEEAQSPKSRLDA
jgi:nucleotide-binding universal stress UspA family protein